MTISNWTETDTKRAQEIWAQYQRDHDVSPLVGQTAGIDPVSGRIWFGDSIQKVADQQDATGDRALLFFVRVGSPSYYRKGGHR
jgi:hypothetical protein